MRSSRATDGALLSSLPWTLAALAVAALPHLPYLPIWITAASAGGALWRLVIEQRRRPVPSAWARGSLALGGFFAVYAAYGTISGVGPGTALLAIMASLKLLEARQRRDQFVLLFIAVFLNMAALLREQYLWSLPYLLLSLIATMAAWLRLTVPAGQPSRQTVGTAIRLIGYALPFAAAMWVFFPRIATPLWSVPIDTSSGLTGLGQTMSPGDITSLSQSDRVAFRVRFDAKPPPPKDRYWRALVLHRFNGRTWSGWSPVPDRRFRERTAFLGDPVDYEITLEPTRTQQLMSLDIAERWDLEQTHVSRTSTLWRERPIDQRSVYRVRSYPRYRLDAELSDFGKSRYLELPDGQNPRTRELARSMRSAARSDRDYVKRVLTMFNVDSFHYTLEPPALGARPVDAFLFATRRGFCEHYASAFAVMMRAAGIPARIVLGYQGGEINPLSDYLIVRQADAHAWTEVWLKGSGWQRVDPTAAVAPERIESGRRGAALDGTGAAWGLSTPSRLAYRLSMTWDAINARWNEFVLAYGPENQQRFMRWLGLRNPDWQRLTLVLAIAVAALVAVVHLLLLLRFRPPPPDRARQLYERFVRRTGVRPRPAETPLDFERRLSTAVDADAAARITRAYLEARYGDGGEQALSELGQAVRAFKRGAPT